MSLTEIEVQSESVGGEPRVIEGRSPWQLAWARLRKDKAALISIVVIILLIIFALIAPLIAKWTGHAVDRAYPNTAVDSTGLPVGPGTNGFLLGADQLGHDLLVRAAYGARTSLLIGLTSTFISMVVGVVVGIVAGYFGRWIDTALSRLLDMVLSFPYLVLAFVVSATIGQSIPTLIFVISFFNFAAMARIVRGQTIQIMEKEYIEAARSLGSGALRIMFVDILPNLVAPIIVLVTLLVPTAITFEATLSFLGAGLDVRTPSWGTMLDESQNFYQVRPMYMLLPALLLLATTLSFNLLGDGVRDALDPRAERVLAKAGK